MLTGSISKQVDWRERVLWFALLTAPLGAVMLFALYPALNVSFQDHWFHFQIVTFVTLVAFVLGVTTIALLRAVQDARAFFIPLGLGAMAGIFFVHGLATPNVLVFPSEHAAHAQLVSVFARPDLAVAWSAPLSLVVGAIFFALASWNWTPRAQQWFLTWRRLMLALLTLTLLAYLVTAIAFPLPFEWLNQFNPAARYAVAIIAALLYLGAAFRFGSAYRQRRERLDGALTLAAVYLATALAPLLLLPLWSAGWWSYHVLMLLAFVIALGAVLSEYERAQHFQLGLYFGVVGVMVIFLFALVAGDLVARVLEPFFVGAAMNLVRWSITLIFVVSALVMLGALGLVVRRGDKLLRANGLKLQQQQAELERARLTHALIPIGVALSEMLDTDAVLELICRESHALFQVDTALLWYRQGDELLARSVFGKHRAEFLGMRQPLYNNTLLGARVVREERPLYVNHALHSKNVHADIVARFHIQSILGVPLARANQVVGALVLMDLENAQRFGALDLDLARVFAQQAAHALTNAQLYEKIQQQTHALTDALGELRANYNQTLAALSAALDARDRETEGHSRRVTAYALRLADALNIHDAKARQAIEWGALLHDVGKIGVPDAILHKQGPLTALEWVLMRQHPEIGYQILQNIPYLEPAYAIVRHHHEQWDGSGYPLQLCREDIPLAARIFALADALDAITTARPYRDARSFHTAFQEIKRMRGAQFDPALVDVFLEISETQWKAAAQKIEP